MVAGGCRLLGGLYRGTGCYATGRNGNIIFLKKVFSQQEQFTGGDILREGNTTVYLLAGQWSLDLDLPPQKSDGQLVEYHP